MIRKDNSQACIYEGVTYKSYTELGRTFGVSPDMVKRRLRMGEPINRRTLHVRQEEWWARWLIREIQKDLTNANYWDKLVNDW